MCSLLQSNVALQIFFAKLINTLFTPWTALATLALLITDTAYKTRYNTCTTYNKITPIKIQFVYFTMFINLQFIDKSVVIHKNMSCTHTQVMASRLITVNTMAASCLLYTSPSPRDA